MASASVNLATTRAFVSYDPARLTTEELCGAVCRHRLQASPVAGVAAVRHEEDTDHWGTAGV